MYRSIVVRIVTLQCNVHVALFTGHSLTDSNHCFVSNHYAKLVLMHVGYWLFQTFSLMLHTAAPCRIIWNRTANTRVRVLVKITYIVEFTYKIKLYSEINLLGIYTGSCRISFCGFVKETPPYLPRQKPAQPPKSQGRLRC